LIGTAEKKQRKVGVGAGCEEVIILLVPLCKVKFNLDKVNIYLVDNIDAFPSCVNECVCLYAAQNLIK